MYEPPAGYDDFAADAARVPISGDLEELEIPTVGTVMARRPMPRSASALASAANAKLGEIDRMSYLMLFVMQHLDDDDVDRLLVSMMNGTLPETTIQRVARSLATWGTARPYTAVGTLVVITAHHWRTVRAYLASNGISEPMTRFSSMHSLLDVTERMAMESLSHSGEGKDAHIQAKRKMDQFMDSLYAPEMNPDTAINGDGYLPKPAGFDEEEIEASFDQFLKAAP